MYENGRLQPITVFDYGDAPIALGVVVDRSQSMRPKTLALGTALSSLLESSGPDDELFGVNFHDDASLALAREPFTHDANELTIALSAVRAAGRGAMRRCGRRPAAPRARTLAKGAHRQRRRRQREPPDVCAGADACAPVRRGHLCHRALGCGWRRKRKTQGCSSASPEKRAASRKLSTVD